MLTDLGSLSSRLLWRCALALVLVFAYQLQQVLTAAVDRACVVAASAPRGPRGVQL